MMTTLMAEFDLLLGRLELFAERRPDDEIVKAVRSLSDLNQKSRK